VIFTTLAIGTINIFKILWGDHIPSSLLNNLHISDGNSLSADYNFYTLFIIVGWIFFLQRNSLNYSGRAFSRFYLIPFNVIFILNILLSGSRRGILAFVVIVIFLIVVKIIELKKNHVFFSTFYKKGILSIGIFIFILGLFLLIFQRIPRDKISLMAFRYYSFIGNKDYSEVYKKIWSPRNLFIRKSESYSIKETYNLKPGSWIGNNHQIKLHTIKTIYGEGFKAKIVSKGNEDLKIIYEQPYICLANHTYHISFKMQSVENKNKSILAGWWTDDGDHENLFTYSNSKIDSIGDNWYTFNSYYTFIDNHTGIELLLSNLSDNSEFIIADFTVTDMNFDTNLQALKFNKLSEKQIINHLNTVNPPINDGRNLINNGNFREGMKFWSYSASELSIIEEKEDSINYLRIKRGDGDGEYYSLFYVGRSINYFADNEYQLSFNLKPIFPKSIPFQVGYWLDEGDGYLINLKLDIDTLDKGWLNVKANYKFKSNQKNLVFPLNSQIDNSEFFISNISLINLSQTQFQHTLSSEPLKETMIESRTRRWKYGWDIWKNQYSCFNKIFGKGFNYYAQFGQKFLTDRVGNDYPHNPVISVLLYSGIFGVLLYIYLIYISVQYYLAYQVKNNVYFICFLIIFFFSFFSGSSPFDPPIMGFFVILPFYLNYFNKKNESGE
jgi:hypothetical protein